MLSIKTLPSTRSQHAKWHFRSKWPAKIIQICCYTVRWNFDTWCTYGHTSNSDITKVYWIICQIENGCLASVIAVWLQVCLGRAVGGTWSPLEKQHIPELSVRGSPTLARVGENRQQHRNGLHQQAGQSPFLCSGCGIASWGNFFMPFCRFVSFLSCWRE